MNEPTLFYGACSVCNTGYWAEVVIGPDQAMCGPDIKIVCQEHHPVSDVRLDNALMFGANGREKWERWRDEVDGGRR